MTYPKTLFVEAVTAPFFGRAWMEKPVGYSVRYDQYDDDAADRVAQLERELAEYRKEVEHLNEMRIIEGAELAAEKELADQYKDALSNISAMGFSDDPAVAANIARYAVEMARKARGCNG